MLMILHNFNATREKEYETKGNNRENISIKSLKKWGNDKFAQIKEDMLTRDDVNY